MRNIASVLFVFLILVACTNSKKENNLHITGNIKGLKKGTLYIQRIKDTTFVVLDTIHIDGKSNFESYINIESPEMLYLFLDRGETNSLDNNLMFFAEPGKINIDANMDYFTAQGKITGSKNQELYDEYRKITRKFNDEQLSLIEKNFQAIKEQNQATLDSIEQKYNQLILRKYRYAANFALNNANYEVAPYIALTEIYNANIKYLDTISKSMSPDVAASKYGKKLTVFIAERKKEEIHKE